jgi:hypothetical protein
VRPNIPFYGEIKTLEPDNQQKQCGHDVLTCRFELSHPATLVKAAAREVGSLKMKHVIGTGNAPAEFQFLSYSQCF